MSSAPADERHDSSRPRPLAQILLDDIFLLLTLGVAVPFLFYIVWGLIELAELPLFQP